MPKTFILAITLTDKDADALPADWLTNETQANLEYELNAGPVSVEDITAKVERLTTENSR